jgi:Fe-only nitrogenase accessory protein AnfO
MKIAVFVDEKGNAVPYHSEGIIALYAFDGNDWHCTKKTPLASDQSTNIAEVRERINAVIAEIEDAKVLMIETIKSLPIAVFDGFGITVWKHRGIPTEAFNYVKEQEANKVRQPRSCCDSPNCKSTCSPKTDECASVPSPITFNNIGSGLYTIDLAKILAGNSSLNSKQILIPFFQNTAFKTLEIICQHVPKWFDREFEKMRLQIEHKESTDDLCHVIVSPQK